MKLKNIFKSIRAKLFLTLCIVIVMIIAFFVIISNAVLETLYYTSKKDALLEAFEYVDSNVSKEIKEEEKDKYESTLEKMSVKHGFEIVISNGENIIYETNKNFSKDFGTLNDITYDIDYSIFNKSDIMYSREGVSLRKIMSKANGLDYVLLKGYLKNENEIYIRTPISPIEDSADISNKFIYVIGFVTIAKVFGNRDRTTVMHGVDRIMKNMNTDKELKDEINFITKNITS